MFSYVVHLVSKTMHYNMHCMVAAPLIYPYYIQGAHRGPTGTHNFEGLHTQCTLKLHSLPFISHFSLQAKSDYFKLIFAALILVVLRLWDAIYVSLGYLPHYNTDIRPSTWIVVLVFLAVRLKLCSGLKTMSSE